MSLTKTAIPYLTHSFPVFTGCLPDQPCWHRCWARGMARRFKRDFSPQFHADRLADPLRLRGSGHVVGVAFGGDLGLMTPGEIAATLGACALRPDLSFVLATKRPEALRSALILIGERNPREPLYARGRCACVQGYFCMTDRPWNIPPGDQNEPWPLPNVYLGWSAWDQASFDAGWKALSPLVSAGWRVWVSLEPMLGPVSLTGAAWRLASVIVGAESGPGARPLDLAWVRAVRDQCAAAGVPFSYKQGPGDRAHRKVGAREWVYGVGCCGDGAHRDVTWLGKAARVPVLDGETHTALAWRPA